MSLFTTTCEPLPPRGLWPTPTINGNYNRAGLSAKSGDGLATAVLMSSAAASPARTSPPQARARALPAAAADYGKSTPELLGKFDLATRSLKTSQRCFIEGWQTFSSTFPRSGMMRNGTAYALPMLVPHTGATGYGSLPTHSIPTPTASDHIERRSTSTETLNFATNKSVSLDRFAKMWPTPTSRDWKDGSAQACANVPANALLGRVVHQWATPRTADSKGQGMARDRADKPDNLAAQIGGSLNPTWVEWLMGFPLGWTDLER
jgi:hypothetical protein